MAHEAEHSSQLHMGLPLPNGKLAIWIFLVTEITFFTALIGTYMLLRNGQPTGATPWPTPHDVHLIEWIGAFNTFVLICSSLTVVLCHWCLHEARKEAEHGGWDTESIELTVSFDRDPATRRRLAEIGAHRFVLDAPPSGDLDELCDAIRAARSSLADVGRATTR